MRTGRPKPPLIVTEEERERLESLAHRAQQPSSVGSPRSGGVGVCGGAGQ